MHHWRSLAVKPQCSLSLLEQIVTKREAKDTGLPLGPERSVPVAQADLSDTLSPTHPRAHPQSRSVKSVQDGSVSAQPGSSKGALSRLDAEIEALRRSPTPTQGRLDKDEGGQSSSLTTNPFLDGVAFMGIFSRTRDIIAANFNDMLDNADDPQKMIRMIILEMEETLVEVRASAARTIADQKEMHRHVVKLDRLEADWAEKANLALRRPRRFGPCRFGRKEKSERNGRSTARRDRRAR